MRTETRTRIAEPDDAIRAAFDLFEAVVARPEDFSEKFDGATFRPAERVELSDGDGCIQHEISFQVFLPQRDKAECLPEPSRVLIEA